MITVDMLKKLSPKAKDSIVNDIVKYLNIYLLNYEINIPLRIAHFMAQAAHESDGFKTLSEYWGPTEAQKRYEGRRDLGNVEKGDGYKYRGRGIFQLTGRANYRQMGKKLNVDLQKEPDLAATGEISVQTALEYWKSRNLNMYADKDDIKEVTRRINGGYNGLEDRINYLNRAKKIFANVTIEKETKKEEKKSGFFINIPISSKGDRSTYLKDLQEIIVSKGYSIKVDGIFGIEMYNLMKKIQKENNLEETGNLDTNTLNVIMSKPNK